jgi:hypothetical protein
MMTIVEEVGVVDEAAVAEATCVDPTPGRLRRRLQESHSTKEVVDVAAMVVD